MQKTVSLRHLDNRLTSIENKINSLVQGGQKTMSALDTLVTDVAAIASDSAAASAEVASAITLVKELVAALPSGDDPRVVAALAALETAHASFNATTQSLDAVVKSTAVPVTGNPAPSNAVSNT